MHKISYRLFYLMDISDVFLKQLQFQPCIGRFIKTRTKLVTFLET